MREAVHAPGEGLEAKLLGTSAMVHGLRAKVIGVM